MTWKKIDEFEDYEVSDTGLVRSLKYGKKKILSPGRNRKGYLMVHLWKDGKATMTLVHRLVAAAFIPNPMGLATVNHRDEVKTNNSVANLEWMTVADNCRYGTHGTRIALALRNQPALSKSVLQLDKLGNLVRQFPSAREASRQTGTAQSSISRACRGKLKTAGGYIWKFA